MQSIEAKMRSYQTYGASADVIAVGDRIFLRRLHETDATPEYAGWLSDPEVNKFLDTKNATVDSLKAYIRMKRAYPNVVFCGIFLPDGAHIGNIKIEMHDGEAVLGILIGDKKSRGNGYCADALRLMAAYAFTATKIERITLGVITENTSAIKCYKKAGFHIDELKPMIGINADRYKERYIMHITRDDYLREKV